MIFFLTILRSSLAFLPDPDNCCKTVKIKTNGEFTWLWNGDIYKLKGDYLENETGGSRIYYHVADEEWRISYIGYPERLSNSSQKCPENVEDWFGCIQNMWSQCTNEVFSSNLKIVCYTPWYKKYWYVIVIVTLLSFCCCCCCCCFCCKRLQDEAKIEVSTVMKPKAYGQSSSRPTHTSYTTSSTPPHTSYTTNNFHVKDESIWTTQKTWNSAYHHLYKYEYRTVPVARFNFQAGTTEYNYESQMQYVYTYDYCSDRLCNDFSHTR